MTRSLIQQMKAISQKHRRSENRQGWRVWRNPARRCYRQNRCNFRIICNISRNLFIRWTFSDTVDLQWWDGSFEIWNTDRNEALEECGDVRALPSPRTDCFSCVAKPPRWTFSLHVDYRWWSVTYVVSWCCWCWCIDAPWNFILYRIIIQIGIIPVWWDQFSSFFRFSSGELRFIFFRFSSLLLIY